jgi:hypothetical protein
MWQQLAKDTLEFHGELRDTLSLNSFFLDKLIDFWNHRDQLSFSDGLIMKGHTIVIPKELRSEMLETVHAG